MALLPALPLLLLLASLSHQAAIWPLSYRDPKNTNYSPTLGLGATAWTISAQKLSPIPLTYPSVNLDAIGLDGMIVGTIGSVNASFVFALAANGSLLFNVRLPSGYFAPVVIGANGNIYTVLNSAPSYSFYAFSPMGKILWTKPTSLNLGIPNFGILPNGNLIFIASMCIVSLDSTTGAELWKTQVGQNVLQFRYNPLVIDPQSGTSYFILQGYLQTQYVNGSVVGISMDGSSVWQTSIGSEFIGEYGLVIQSNGMIVTQYGGYFTSLSPSGQFQWMNYYPFTQNCTFSGNGISADSSDNLYSSTGFCCLSFDMNGNLRWNVNFDEPNENFVAGMIPSLGSKIVYGSTGYTRNPSDGLIYELDMNSGNQVNGVKFPGQQIFFSPIVAQDKVLYFVSEMFNPPYNFFLNSVLLS